MLTPEGPRRRAVKIGLSDRTSAQVVSGLTVGDNVIVGTTDGSTATRQAGGGGRPGGLFGFRL